MKRKMTNQFGPLADQLLDLRPALHRKLEGLEALCAVY
jgi:hypothetical protein